MKYCARCGKELHDEAVMCTGCGCMVAPIPQAKPKSPSVNTDKTLILAKLFNFIYSILGIITVTLFVWAIFILFDEDIIIASTVFSIGAFTASVLGFIMTFVSKPKLDQILKAVTNLVAALSMFSIGIYILTEI